MCVIVQVGAKKSIAKQVLENCYDNNPDGWGIMYALDGKLQTIKEVSNFDAFYTIWREVPRDAERAIHFRIKTHGEINDANCHPFMPTENIALMHNGIITTQMLDAKMSDTFNFTEYELKPVMSGWEDCLEAEEFKTLIEDVTGYSKLLFMSNEGKTLRLRPNLWTERNGIVFSNSNSYEKRYSYRTPSRHYGSNWPVVTRELSKYDPLKTETAIENSNVASDLYSGNKTDEEGQKYIRSINDERVEEIRQLNAERNQDIVEETEDIEGDDPTFTLDYDQLNSMSFQDKLDWVQDYPKSAVYVIDGLMDTLEQAGLFDMPHVSILGKKSAVK